MSTSRGRAGYAPAVPRTLSSLAWLASIVALSCAAGCQYGAYFFRPTREPMQGLEVRMDPAARRSCLVVLMPGMLNTPDDYFERGFVADAVAASRRCDIVAVDAHYAYYRTNTMEQRVGEDILRIAERRGYRDIWLVGVSMGAMGAMRVAQEWPDLVDGVVVLGPWFGDAGLIQSIVDAGGLARWHGPEDTVRAHGDPRQEAMWEWMRGYATHPDRMPALYVGVGAADGMRTGAEVLAEHLPSTHFGLAEGGHEWAALRVLWRRLLAHPPWDPGDGVPRIDRSSGAGVNPG